MLSYEKIIKDFEIKKEEKPVLIIIDTVQEMKQKHDFDDVKFLDFAIDEFLKTHEQVRDTHRIIRKNNVFTMFLYWGINHETRKNDDFII